MDIFRNQRIITMNWSNIPRAIPKSQWAYVFKTIGELIDSGFSLHQILTFMGILLPKYGHLFDKVNLALGQGVALEVALGHLGFGKDIQAQIFNAQKQGRLAMGCRQIGVEIEEVMHFKKSLIKVLTYPVLLTIFLTCVLFGMRYFMLDQITGFVSQATYDQFLWVRCLIHFFVYLPQIIIVVCSVILGCLGLYQIYLRQFTMIERYRILVKIPILQPLIRKICSYKVARDLGQFYEAGYSIQQTIQYLLKFPLDPFMTSVAQQLHQGYLQGLPLDHQLKDMGIFTETFPCIIKQGEMTSQLAQQCRIYAQKIFKECVEDIMKKIQWIQPILFLGIAFIILAIYLLMIMPMLTMSEISI